MARKKKEPNDHPQRQAIAGAAGAPLSSEQKREICMLARKVWALLGEPGYADQAANLPQAIRMSKAEAFEVWRQDEQRRAAGTLHLTCAQQKDFPAYMAHFSGLLAEAQRQRGNTRTAAAAERRSEQWHARNADDDARRAQAVLARALFDAADVIEQPRQYASAIARSKFKVADINTLSAKQTWTLVFDVRRAAQRRRKGAA